MYYILRGLLIPLPLSDIEPLLVMMEAGRTVVLGELYMACTVYRFPLWCRNPIHALCTLCDVQYMCVRVHYVHICACLRRKQEKGINYEDETSGGGGVGGGMCTCIHVHVHACTFYTCSTLSKKEKK